MFGHVLIELFGEIGGILQYLRIRYDICFKEDFAFKQFKLKYLRFLSCHFYNFGIRTMYKQNKQITAHCAIYGTSFMNSAKMTWNLFKTRGFMALINDDLTGMVLFAGAMIGGVVTAGCGGAVGYAFYGGDDDESVKYGIPGALAGTGFLIGMILTMTTLYVVRSSVVALFVCFAEEPAALHENRPEEYQRLTGAKPEFQEFYNTYGTGQRNEGTGV